MSCNKFVEVPAPGNILTGDLVFSDDQSATLSVTGLYSRGMSGNLFFLNGAMSLYPALSADELSRTSPSMDLDAFANNAISSSSRIITNDIWKNVYNYIYHANACIEGISGSAVISPSVKNQLIGEMKFMRALCYFYLVNLFGDVPLETTTDYRVNASMPRTQETQVYDQIIKDLKEAEGLLSGSYPTPEKIRPNKWCATALMARAYLYRRNWAEAENAASSIIGSKAYKLLDNPDSVFLANSNEAILQFFPVLSGLNTAEGNVFLPPQSSSFKPAYILTNYIIGSFEAGDKRQNLWVGTRIVAGQTYYYPSKYKIKFSDVGAAKTEYNMVLRFAEIDLIRAEARARQGNIGGAQNDLNAIRFRAGLPATTANTQATLLTAVEHERQLEFFTEWGHRWFDLKRTRQADSVLSNRKPGWQPAAVLYPIPQTEIQVNPSLVQNPGY